MSNDSRGKSNKNFVFALYFGVDSISYGYGVPNKETIFVNTHWSCLYGPKTKCPSYILYYKNTKCWNIGEEALEIYQQIDVNDFSLIGDLQLLLCNETDEYLHTNGVFSITQIIVDYLTCIKKDALNISKKIYNFEGAIKWVFSIPSNWNHKIIQKYKNCILKAGIEINDEHIQIIKESKASLIYSLFRETMFLGNQSKFLIENFKEKDSVILKNIE